MAKSKKKQLQKQTYKEGEPDKEKQYKCLALLVKMAGNIVDKPNEPKFKKIKMENPTFVRKVGECK